MYIYQVIRHSRDKEQQAVGYMDGTGKFHVLLVVDTIPQALDLIHWLNGGVKEGEAQRLVRAVETIASRLDAIGRHMP